MTHFFHFSLANSVFYEEVKISFRRSESFILQDAYLSTEEIRAFSIPNVTHYRFVNEVQSARSICGSAGHNRSINNFKVTLKTFYHHLNYLV